MSQVIIFTNENGNVSVCIPTGELPIQDVLVKDCPSGAVIVDDSTLPQGTDAQFFNAWRLNGSTVTVDIVAAQAMANDNLNSQAKAEAQHRATNVAIGLTNKMADADWLNALTAARAAITAATTTAELVAAVEPVQAAIADNA